MSLEVLVLHPPTANLTSTLGFRLHHQNQPQELLQALSPQVAGLPQRGIAIDEVSDLGLAS